MRESDCLRGLLSVIHTITRYSRKATNIQYSTHYESGLNAINTIHASNPSVMLNKIEKIIQNKMRLTYITPLFLYTACHSGKILEIGHWQNNELILLK